MPLILQLAATYAPFSCSSECSDSPVQCCLIAMPQGNTVKKLTADRRTQGHPSLYSLNMVHFMLLVMLSSYKT